jgi:hypothetical protein
VRSSILEMSETAMTEAESARATARAMSDIAHTSATTRDRMEQMREAMDGLVARASALLRRLRFFRLGPTGALRGTIVTTGGPQVSPQVPTGGPALFSGWRTGGAVPTGAPTVQPLAPTQSSSIPPATPPPWDAPATRPSAGAAPSPPASADVTPAGALSVDAEIAEAWPESRNRQTVPIPIVEGTLVDAVDAGYTPDSPDSIEALDNGQTMPLSAEDVGRKTAPPDLADREAPTAPNAE